MKPKITHIEKGSMRRVLGVTDLFAVGYGDLGSSIYYALGITALYALGATPIALLLAGLVFACTALTYSELSAMTRQAGGSASFTRTAFNDLVSFIAGWGLLLDFIVTIAISAYAISPYLSFFLPILKDPFWKISFTSMIITLLIALNISGAKHSTRFSLYLTGATLLTQFLIIIIGLFWLGDVRQVIENLRINMGTAVSPTWPQFWKGCAMAMVAYTGIESMSQLTGEARTPAKTVPKAILIAMGTLIFVYIGMSIVALSALTPEALSTTYLEDPISGIVSAFPFGGKILAPWIGLLAGVILLVAANAGLIGASRLSFNMGEYYQLPRFFYKLHSRTRTPFVSLSIFGLLAILIVVWSGGKLAFLADLYNFGAMLAFFAAHLSLLMLRIRKPNLERPFKVPFNIRFKKYELPITSIVGCLATFATWILVIVTKPEGRYLGSLWVGLGLVMYIAYRKKKRIAPAAQVEIEKIKLPEFQKARYTNILVPTRGGEDTRTLQIAAEIANVHGAKLTAVHIIEVPFSMPLETRLYQRRKSGERALKRAEAIAREFGVTVQLEIVQARSISKAVLEECKKHEADLIVLGATAETVHYGSGLGAICEHVLRASECPVWIAKN